MLRTCIYKYMGWEKFWIYIYIYIYTHFNWSLSVLEIFVYIRPYFSFMKQISSSTLLSKIYRNMLFGYNFSTLNITLLLHKYKHYLNTYIYISIFIYTHIYILCQYYVYMWMIQTIVLKYIKSMQSFFSAPRGPRGGLGNMYS